jgi:hypothetical protein
LGWYYHTYVPTIIWHVSTWGAIFFFFPVCEIKQRGAFSSIRRPNLLLLVQKTKTFLPSRLMAPTLMTLTRQCRRHRRSSREFIYHCSCRCLR